MSDTSYKTIKLDFVAEGLFEDRKSRFIAQLCHVETESEAQEFLDTCITPEGFLQTAFASADCDAHFMAVLKRK